MPKRILANPSTEGYVSIVIYNATILIDGEETYRLVALVPTLLSKSLLVLVDEPTVPRWKVAREMNEQRLVDVCHNEVVELAGSQFLSSCCEGRAATYS